LSRPQLAYSTPEFDDSDPIVCLWLQLRPSLWAVVFGLLEQLAQDYSWRVDDPACATVQEVITELIKATSNLPNQRCDMLGEVKFITTAIPDWMLLCDGDTYNRTDYPDLYGILDAAYIIDADTFRVPDLIGRFPLGAATPGTEGGAFEITPDLTQLTPHHHTYTEIVLNASVVLGELAGLALNDDTTSDTGNTGGGEPIDITNPFHELIPVIVARLPQAGD